MNFRHVFVVGVVFAAVFACNNSVIKPPEGPDTEYPCGIHGKSCGNHMCCGEYDVCGYDGPWSRCPAGYCCYDGPPDWPGAAPDASAQRAHEKQWREGSKR